MERGNKFIPSNMSAALSHGLRCYIISVATPMKPFPLLPAGLFHCVSRISILRSLDLNRLTGELSGITVSRFINVVNLVSKCFLARVWPRVYICACVWTNEERGRLAGSRQREEKIKYQLVAKDYLSILRYVR